MTPFDSRSLEDRLARLFGVDAGGWTGYRMAKDPLREKMDADTGRELAAAAAGRAEAALASLVARFGGASPEAWAGALGLTVADAPPAGDDSPPFLSLAERRGKRIVVTREALAVIGRSVCAYGLADRAGDDVLWRDMLLSHELYHHLEWMEPDAYRPRDKVTSWRFAGFAWRTTPMCASEMSAMHFSFLATGGRFQPDIVELLFLAGRDPALAWKWAGAALGET